MDDWRLEKLWTASGGLSRNSICDKIGNCSILHYIVFVLPGRHFDVQFINIIHQKVLHATILISAFCIGVYRIVVLDYSTEYE